MFNDYTIIITLIGYAIAIVSTWINLTNKVTGLEKEVCNLKDQIKEEKRDNKAAFEAISNKLDKISDTLFELAKKK
jgi:hypothetical protein